MDEEYNTYDRRIDNLIYKRYGQKYYEDLINQTKIKIEQSNSEDFKKTHEIFIREWKDKLQQVNKEIQNIKDRGCKNGLSYLCPIAEDDWLSKGESPPGYIEMPEGSIAPEDSVEAQWRKADNIYDSEEQRAYFERASQPKNDAGIIWTDELHVTDPDPLLIQTEKKN